MIPTFQLLTLPVLRESAKGEVRIADVIEGLAHQFQLTAEERSRLLPSGKQTVFSNRVAWAKTYLAKAGLVEGTRRGHFRATEQGIQVLSSPPEKIDVAYLMQFPGMKAFREGSTIENERPFEAAVLPSTQTETLTPDEIMRAAASQLEKALAGDLLDRMMSGTPAFFESLVVRLLIAMGYGGSITELEKALVGKTGDGGVDGVIDQDSLGLDRIYVQSKRYAADNSVGSSAIRDFFGSLDRFKATKGLFVTTSTFTSSARETAELLSKRIVLVDGQQLARLMIRYEVGCRVVETLTIKQLDEEFFAE